MGKITDYERVENLNGNEIFIAETESGTKGVPSVLFNDMISKSVEEKTAEMSAAVGALSEGKVDKADGKDLSANDYTDEEKNSVAEIPGIKQQLSEIENWEVVFEKTYTEDTTGTATWALSKPCRSVVIKVVSVGTAQNTKDWITGIYPQAAGSQQYVNCLRLHTDPASSYVGLARLDYAGRMIYSHSQYSALVSGIPNINTRFESSAATVNPDNFVYVVSGDKGAITQLQAFLDTSAGTRYIGAGSTVKIWGC